MYLSLLTKKMHVWGLFCDLAKTLDCINHDTVLNYIFMALSE
jgi:hypothetical protein